MSKGRKKKKTYKRRISSKGPSDRIQKSSIQKLIKEEKERMLSVLNFDEQLRDKVEDMFNINFEGLPAGKESMTFSTAVFKIDNTKLAMTKIEQLVDVDLEDKDKEGAYYVWTRAYPKGHWNPMSSMPSSRQIIGHIHVNFDNTLKLETKTKSWMTGLIYYMINTLGKDIKLFSLEFQNPMDLISE